MAPVAPLFHPLPSCADAAGSSLHQRGEPRTPWGYQKAARPAREPMRQVLYSSQVQQLPLTIATQHDRQHTELAGMTAKRSEAPLVRDEEAASFGLPPLPILGRFAPRGSSRPAIEHARLSPSNPARSC